ncbi:PAS domain S-box protein [Mucilaginibacter sp.]|uniref:PAS domain S-box protein n=1 Tax=Mucilaginibacter sp. TaxID=1882438 RepID=UPI003D0E1A80
MLELPPTALNDLALALDLNEQKFLFVSPAIATVLGYNAVDLYKNPNLLQEIIAVCDKERIAEINSKLYDGETVELKYQIITASGEKKRVCEKKDLFTDPQSGHKIMLSVISEVLPGSKDTEVHISKQFLNSLIDSQTNFLIRIDINGLFTFANKQFLKSFGYSNDDIIGKHFSTTVLAEELSMCKKAFYNCISNPGKVTHLVHKKIDKAGGLSDTEWEFIAIVNENGLVNEIQGIGHDITLKINIEKEIKRTSEKMDTFIESITDSFFIVNNDWQFVKVNAAFEKVWDKKRGDILGHVLWDIFPRIKGTEFEEAYRKAAAENIRIQFAEYFEPFDKWFNTTVYPSSEGLTVFIKDISEEMRVQEELSWTKNSLEGLINNTEDQIWSIDKETRYVYMNNAYRNQITHLSGFEPLEGAYSNQHSGYSAEIIETWDRYYKRAFEGEIYTVINESIDPVTGEVLCFEISFNPIFNTKGEITGIGCFARDITQRLKTEKAIIDQNDRLRHIASLTSHELRRPVASLLGLINIMDRSNFFNPDNKEIMEHLLTVGNEIDEVIRQVVDKTFTDDLSNKYQIP